MSSEGRTRQCPDCGSELMDHNQAPGTEWCDEYEKEYWREGDNWMSCGVEGTPKLVLPDGGSR